MNAHAFHRLPYQPRAAWDLAHALATSPRWRWRSPMMAVSVDGSCQRYNGYLLDREALPLLTDAGTMGALLAALEDTGEGWREVLLEELATGTAAGAIGRALLRRQNL